MELDEVVRRLANTEAALDSLKDYRDALQQKLVAHLVSDDDVLTGPWGSFAYPWRAGRVHWQRLAEELHGGPLPKETIERHRGAPWREPRLYLKETK